MVMFALVFASEATAQSFGLVEFFSSGKRTSGGLLYQSPGYTMALGVDGRLHELEGNEAAQIFETGKRFEPDSPLRMRSILQSEYGKNFEVVATKDFLIVQPVGRGNRWPDLFQNSHNAFVDYMRSRGVRVSAGNFPMVAIVSPDETAMRAEFRRLNLDVGRVLGVYHPFSNRVMTHDGGNQQQANATVRHEAAHQSGYNTGVHSRINDMPQWIIEGVGQMFEPESMAERRQGASRGERVNRQALGYVKTHHNDPIRFIRDVQSIVRHENLFEGKETQIADAYAIAWTMMFYLGERNHRVFAELLNFTSSRPPFVAYDPADRQADFERIVGMSTEQFATQVHRFIDKL